MVNTPERVEITKKTTQALFVVKRGGLLLPKGIMLLITVQEKRERGIFKR
jgi:hypothetical protein